MRAMLLGSLVALVAGCGGGFTAAVVVSFDIDEPPPDGGGYRVTLLRPGGSPIPGLDPQFVASRDGDQNVTLVLESEVLYGGSDTAAVRVLAEAVLTRDAGAGEGVAVGSAVVSVSKGGTAEETVRLLADPRPIVAPDGVVARYNS